MILMIHDWCAMIDDASSIKDLLNNSKQYSGLDWQHLQPEQQNHHHQRQQQHPLLDEHHQNHEWHLSDLDTKKISNIDTNQTSNLVPSIFHIHPAFSEAMRQDKIWPVEGTSAPPRILCGTGEGCHQNAGTGLSSSKYESWTYTYTIDLMRYTLIKSNEHQLINNLIYLHGVLTPHSTLLPLQFLPRQFAYSSLRNLECCSRTPSYIATHSKGGFGWFWNMRTWGSF